MRVDSAAVQVLVDLVMHVSWFRTGVVNSLLAEEGFFVVLELVREDPKSI